MIRAWKIVLMGIVALAVCAFGQMPWMTILPVAKDRQVTALSNGGEWIAIGYSKGGLVLLNQNGQFKDSLSIPDFGSKRRINDLAWWKSWLLVATEGGISVWDVERRQMVVHLNGKKLGFLSGGAYSLGVRGPDLWVGGLGQIAQVNLEQKKLQSTWSLPGNPGRCQAVLVIGGSAYVGTEGDGVNVLDLSQGTWKKFDRFDGLPDGQVTGLEWVGTKLFVATTQGLGGIDLGLESVKTIDSSWIITYMAESGGKLYLSTLDGLVQMDGETLKSQIISFKDKLLLAGDLQVRNGELISGSEFKGVIRANLQESLLGSSDLEYLPQGFGFKIRKDPLPTETQLGVRIWFPERPAAAVILDAIPGTDQGERLVKLPDDAVGRFVIEIAILRGKEIVERRTLQMYRDRSPPTLDLDAIPPFVRESPLLVKGSVLEKSLSSLQLEPKGGKVKINEQGKFEVKVPLEQGVNLFAIVARDQAGNEVQFPMQTVLDNQLPQVNWPSGKDTISENTAFFQMKLKEDHLKGVLVEPSDKGVANTTDSSLMLTFHNLVNGKNQIIVTVEDEATNVNRKVFELYVQDERSRIIESMDNQAKNAAQPIIQVRVDTVYKNVPCPEKPATVEPLPQSSQTIVVRYLLKRGETLRLVAERFYGDREMYRLLAQYNKILDEEELYRLPIGKPILVPIWKNFEHGKWKTLPDPKILEAQKAP